MMVILLSMLVLIVGSYVPYVAGVDLGREIPNLVRHPTTSHERARLTAMMSGWEPIWSKKAACPYMTFMYIAGK